MTVFIPRKSRHLPFQAEYTTTDIRRPANLTFAVANLTFATRAWERLGGRRRSKQINRSLKEGQRGASIHKNLAPLSHPWLGKQKTQIKYCICHNILHNIQIPSLHQNKHYIIKRRVCPREKHKNLIRLLQFCDRIIHYT